MKQKVLVGILATTVFVFAVSTVTAEESDNSTETTSTPTVASTPKSDDSRGRDFKELKEREKGRFENFKESFSPRPTGSPKGERDGKRLEELKLKACEAREENIKKKTSSLMNLVSGMVGKFDAIAKRVEEFYTTKVLPTGKVVTNYDALVADINTKKTAVDEALKNVPDTEDFDCSSDDPKGLLTEFRTDMQAVKTALHEYRTSIKNLIKAVHEVAGDKDRSPKPSSTPVATPTT